MRRVLVVPAAGRATRLGSPESKLLIEVAGRPIIDWLADLYRTRVARWYVVVRPGQQHLIESHGRRLGVPLVAVVQEEPTGMLDAVLTPLPLIRNEDVDEVWVTWCDQVAVHPRTVAWLDELGPARSGAALVLPTCRQSPPYIHFERDESGRIVAVRHRREGDAMPETGESDMGLFALSYRAYVDDLAAYAALPTKGGSATHERNFLPFIPWLDARAQCVGSGLDPIGSEPGRGRARSDSSGTPQNPRWPSGISPTTEPSDPRWPSNYPQWASGFSRTSKVLTFDCHDPVESVGINTPQEVELLTRYLRDRLDPDGTRPSSPREVS